MITIVFEYYDVKESAQIWEFYGENPKHNCQNSAQDTIYCLVLTRLQRKRKHENYTSCALPQTPVTKDFAKLCKK